MSSQHTNLPTWSIWIFVGSLLGLTFLCADRLSAGSVFMKNGYIIQGPVVDRDDDSVVLGWDNGKVRIYQRFIESVSYEAGEENRLDENARARLAEERAVEEILAETEEEEPVDEELPADVNVLLEMYGRATLLGDGSDGATTAPAGGESGTVPTDIEPVDDQDLPEVPDVPDGASANDGGTPSVDVRVLAPPSGGGNLAAALTHRSGDFSWRPPHGWELRERAEVTEVRGPTATDGSQPSINVVELPRGGASWDATVEMVKDESRQLLENFEVLGEGELTLGENLVGYELIVKGTLGETTRVVRQLLVPGKDAGVVWLLTGFSSGGPGDPQFALVEDSLRSLVVVE